jgi:hypothetical protein
VTWSLGGELWFVHFDAERNCYVPKLEGTMTRVRGDEVRVNGRWQLVGYPAFTSEAEALAFCSANPKVMPER